MKILTQRNNVNLTSRQVEYEWEDDFAKVLNCNLQDIPWKSMKVKINNFFKIAKPMKYDEKKDIFLFFAMNVSEFHNVCFLKRNVIPIMLDVLEQDIDHLVFLTQNLPVFFVTALETYKILKANGINNVDYLPLSVSDKHFLNQIPQKSIDVVQIGRQNSVLHAYMMEYCKRNPNIDYCYRVKKNDGFSYVSTIRGDIGDIKDRDNYIAFLRKSKISIVSTPGKDDSRSFGDNIDFFTPRWYESIISYCYLIGRYTQNEEAKLLNIGEICPNIESYTEFEAFVDKYLNAEKFIFDEKYKSFIENNRTSARAKYVFKVLTETGLQVDKGDIL